MLKCIKFEFGKLEDQLDIAEMVVTSQCGVAVPSGVRKWVRSLQPGDVIAGLASYGKVVSVLDQQTVPKPAAIPSVCVKKEFLLGADGNYSFNDSQAWFMSQSLALYTTKVPGYGQPEFGYFREGEATWGAPVQKGHIAIYVRRVALNSAITIVTVGSGISYKLMSKPTSPDPKPDEPAKIKWREFL